MLRANNEYKLLIVIDGETLTAKFLSEFSPAYTTPRRIRSRYGELVADASDLHLWEVIFDASLEADYHTRGKAEDEINEFARERWVACRAAAAWIRQAILRDVWLQSRKRALGDLSVDDRSSSPKDLIALLDQLKEDCEKWAVEFLGVKGKRLALPEVAQWKSHIRVSSRTWE